MADYADRGSSNSKVNRNKNTHLHQFTGLFQALTAWDQVAEPRSFSLIGVLVEALQFASFAIGPAYAYNQPVVYEFTVAVFGFLFPIWDANYGEFEFANYIVPIIILWAAIAIAGGIFLAYSTKQLEQSNMIISRGTKLILESLSSWLFLPAMHIFMATMMCSGKSVHNFPKEACFSSMHVVEAIISAVSIVMLFAVGIIISTTLCDTNPQSTHVRGRAHNYVELVVFLSKTMLVIFYHILVESGAVGVYSILLAVTSLGLLALHATVLPFYSPGMTQIRCMTYAVTTLAAVINCVTFLSGSWFRVHRLNSFALAGLAPLAALGGYLVYFARPSAELLHALNGLLNNATVAAHKARFPFKRGIMADDMKLAPARFRTLQDDLVQEFQTDDGGENDATWLAIVRSSTETMIPLINSIMFATDAEVAVRFVEMHNKITNLPITGNHLAFAMRIYQKTVLRFPKSGIARFHFAQFFFIYANKLNIAMELVSEVQLQVHDEHDVLALYSAHKMMIKMKELFGARDNTHVHAFKRARQLHKESLSGMATFWGKLMESKGDLVGPALITNQLTAKRQAASLEYERALGGQTSDRLLLSTYSSFLEHVMCNDAAAEEFRQLAEEAAEEKKNRIMRGSKSKSAFKKSSISTLIEPDDDEIEGMQRSSVDTTMNVILFLVACCSIGLFVTDIIFISSNQRQINAISNIGASRAAAQESALFLRMASQECKTFDNCSIALLANLSLSEIELVASHNRVTYGDYKSTFNTPSMQFAVRPNILQKLPRSGSAPYGGRFAIPGYVQSEAASTLLESGDAENIQLSMWMLPHQIAFLVTSFVNNVAKGEEYERSMLLTDEEMTSRVRSAFTGFVHAQRQEMDNNRRTATIVCSVILGVAVFLCILGYLVLQFSLQDMALLKTNVIKLFTLIPFPTQETLCNQSRSRLETFEQTHAENGEEDNNDAMPDIQAEFDDVDERQQKKKSKSLSISLTKGRSVSLAAFEDNEDQRKMSRFFGKRREDSLFENNEDQRKMSRFFGKRREDSLQPAATVSCLKKDIRKKNRRVKFKIDGIAPVAEPQKKRLAEPKIVMENPSEDIVTEFEQSMRQIDMEAQIEAAKEKKKKEMETNKIIQGGIHADKATVRKAAVPKTESKVDEERQAEIENQDRIQVARMLMQFVGLSCLGLIVLVYVSSAADFASAQNELADKERGIQSHIEMVDRLIGFSDAFCAFPNKGAVVSQHYEKFFDSVKQKEFQELRRSHEDEDNEKVVELIESLIAKTAEVLYICIKTMTQSAREHSSDLANVPYLATFTDERKKCNSEFSTVHPLCTVFPEEFIFPDVFTSATVVESIKEATSLYRRDTMTQIHSLANSTITKLRARSAQKITRTAGMQSNLLSAAFAITVFSAVFYGTRVVLMIGIDVERVIKSTLALSLVATSVILIISVNLASQNESLFQPFQNAIDACNNTRHAYFSRQHQHVIRYAVTADPFTLDHVHESMFTIRNDLRNLEKSLTDIGMPTADVQKLTSQNEDVWRLQQISIYLASAAFALQRGELVIAPSGPQFIASYNFAQEARSEQEAITYSSDPEIQYMYSSPVNDLTNTTVDHLITSARFAILGRRGLNYYDTGYDLITSIEDDIFAKLQQKKDSRNSDVNRLVLASLILSAYFLFCSCTIAALRLIERMLASRASAMKCEPMARAIFSGPTLRCRIAFAFLTTLIVVQFILIVIRQPNATTAAVTMDAAKEREFLIANSLASVGLAQNSIAIDSTFEVADQLVNIKDMFAELGKVRNTLYFSSFSRTPAQQTITFNGTNSLDQQYLLWRSWVETIANLRPVAEPSGTPGNYVIDAHTKATMKATLDAMTAAYPHLKASVRLSSEQYLSDLEKSITEGLIGNVIIFIIVLATILLEARLVFKKVVTELDDEEQGTRLTLNMIPAAVRDLIPKISLYLETGNLIEEADEAVVYKRTTHFTEFINTWFLDTPEKNCFTALDACTTHGFIVINAVGIVQYSHAKIKEFLGYDLVGRNISIILEEHLKGLHDGFLKRFVSQGSGTTRIVGKGRDVVATSQTGIRVHLYMFLDTAMRSNGDVFFVGQLERYDIDRFKDSA